MAKVSIKKITVPGSSRKVMQYKIIRFSVYAALFILGARGVISIIAPPQAVVQAQETPPVLTDEAQSFAEAFAKAYYTFDAKDTQGYLGTLSAYAARGLIADGVGMVPDQITGQSEVVSTLPWKVTQTSPDTSDVDVRVEVIRTSPATFGVEPTKTRFYRMLRVPIGYQGQNFYVNDLPVVIPDTPGASGDVATYPALSEATDSVKVQINQALEDFFKSYSVDPPTKLKYFMQNGQELSGYNGQLNYDSIRELRVYLPEGTPETAAATNVVAYASSIWADAEGYKQLQRHTIHLVFQDDRWFIQSFQGGFKS